MNSKRQKTDARQENRTRRQPNQHRRQQEASHSHQNSNRRQQKPLRHSDARHPKPFARQSYLLRQQNLPFFAQMLSYLSYSIKNNT